MRASRFDLVAALSLSILVGCGSSGGGGVGNVGGGGNGGGAPWTIETVDSSSADVGAYPSLAIGPTGHLHVSYLDGANDNFKYALWDGTTWTRRVIGTSFGGYVSGLWSSVAVDASDVPWVSFHVADVAYELAKWNGASWAINSVPSAESAWAFLGHNRVAINPVDGTPRVVAWMSHSSASLPPNVLAFWMPGLASPVEVSGPLAATDSTFETDGYHNAIAVDSTGAAHLSFVHWDGQPRATTKSYAAYAHQSGASWTIQTIEEVGVPSTAQPWAENFTSIAVDSNGRPHVFYARPLEGAYKYATWNGTSWTIEKVDLDAGYRAEYLALDQAGTPHVCYYGSGFKLHYAKRTGPNAWAKEVVDPSSDDTGYGCGIAVDAAGKVHIAYRDSSAGTLKMAHR